MGSCWGANAHLGSLSNMLGVDVAIRDAYGAGARLCSSAPFDVEGPSAVVFDRLLALGGQSTGVSSPHSTPLYIAREI